MIDNTQISETVAALTCCAILKKRKQKIAEASTVAVTVN